jgi:hypothetical protein
LVYGYNDPDHWHNAGPRVPIGTSSVESHNLTIHPAVPSIQEYEQQACFIPDLFQSTEEALAEGSLSQSPLDLFLYDLQQPILPQDLVSHHPSTYSQPSTEVSSSLGCLLSSSPSTVRSDSPPNTRQGPKDVPDGKKAIRSMAKQFICPSCNDTFFTELRCRKHTNDGCRPRTTCNGCGKIFTLPKDLKRHEGNRQICPVLHPPRLQDKTFACECGVRFARKDTLNRHMKCCKSKRNCRKIETLKKSISATITKGSPSESALW